MNILPKRDKKIGEVISKYIAANTNVSKGLAVVNIKEIYAEELGPVVMSYTEKIYMNKKGVLHLRLTSAPMRAEMMQHKTKLIDLLNEALGSDVVQSIKFL